MKGAIEESSVQQGDADAQGINMRLRKELDLFANVVHIKVCDPYVKNFFRLRWASVHFSCTRLTRIRTNNGEIGYKDLGSWRNDNSVRLITILSKQVILSCSP